MIAQTKPSLPVRVDDITPAWMTSILQKRLPGVVVEAVDIVDVKAETSTKVRVGLTYSATNALHDLPRTLIVKGGFGKNNDDLEWTFTHEMRAYRDFVSDIGINTPICYLADKEDKNPIIVLEDLATPDCEFGNPHKPLSRERAASVLATLAGLHARYWESPDLADDGSLGWVLRTVSGWHLDYHRKVLSPENWAFYVGLPRGAYIPRERAPSSERMLKATDAQWAFHRQGPLTLGHGDAHCANIYFNARGGGLLDWEMRRCPWYHDVSYFLVSSLAVADRRRWEKDLLKHYLDTLVSHGIAAPDFDHAFYCYSREAVYGFVTFVCNGDGTQYWTEEDNIPIVERFSRAVEDLKTFELIEADR